MRQPPERARPSRTQPQAGKLIGMSDRHSQGRPNGEADIPGAAVHRFVTEPTQFFDDIIHPLVGALTIRTGDRALAEDLAQEAIARAWAQWNEVSVMVNPHGWVYRVAFNLAASHWRRARIRRRAERNERNGSDTTERGPELATVEQLVVREAIAGLSRQQQEVVILRHFVKMSVAEAAEALGVSPGTVKTQNHRALTRLRAALVEGDDRGSAKTTEGDDV